MVEQASVTPADIQAAAARLAGRIWRTPVERSTALSAQVGADVWLKYECFQATGSFKLRGALNRLLTLDDGALARGVVTASAGNHGLGVAEAAARLGVTATVIVPETASAAKVHALRQYSGRGIELTLAGAEYDAAEAHALNLSRASGRPFVSAYNDAAVIAGGGTTALEMLEDVADADAIIVPVGGGGLIGGVGVWAKHARPGIRVIGVQSEASPALHAALTAGRLVSVPVEESLADGLAGNIEAGSITLPLTQAVVDEVALVREADIADAMRWLAAEHHVLVEGSAATALAALLAGRVANLAGRRVVLLLTGRNVTYEVMAQVFAQDVPA